MAACFRRSLQGSLVSRWTLGRVPLGIALFLFLAGLMRLPAQVSVWTWRYDNSRIGVNPQELLLTPANVNPSSFGRLFSQVVDGEIYAQPLYLPNLWIPGKGAHNVVFVTTEHDSVYAFDADDDQGGDSAPLWQDHFIDPPMGIRPVGSGDVQCGDVSPEIGITGTPVINPDTGTLYVVTKTWENGQAVQRLHALDVTTGTEKLGGPVTIAATVNGVGAESRNGTIAFNPLMENQRAGLMLDHGVIYIAWASTCDRYPWHGWVMAYDAGTLQQVAVFNATPNGNGGGFWQAGAAPAADAEGNVYLENANGILDAEQGGSDYASTILRLHLNGHQLTPQDQFIPYNADFMNTSNEEPSSGVLVLPDQGDGAPPLVLASSKIGSLYLLNRDQLGGFHAGADSQVVQALQNVSTGIASTPAYWNGFLYLIGGGEYSGPDHLKMFALRQGTLSLTPVGSDSQPFGFPGATPVVSSNGNRNGIVWALRSDGWETGKPAVLYAWDAQSLQRLYSSDDTPGRDYAGAAVKFTVPVVANGKVYVGTHDRLSVYGLLSSDFTFSLTPADQRIDAGDGVTLKAQVTGAGGVPVTLHCQQPSPCNIDPATLNQDGAAAVTIAPGVLSAGRQQVVLGADNGVIQHQTAASVQVQDFRLWLPSSQGTVQAGASGQVPVRLTSDTGYDAQAMLACAQPPAGIHCGFDPVAINSGTPASSLTLSVDAGVPSGSYPLSIVASHGNLQHSAVYTLQLLNVQLQAAPAMSTVTPQETAQVTIRVTGGASSHESVQLSCGPAQGATCSFQPAVLHSGESSQLTIAHLDAAGAGLVQIPVIGTIAMDGGSTVNVQTPVTLNIVDFSLSVNGASQVLDRSQKSAQFTVMTQAKNGMTQSLNLSCSVAPPVSCSVAPEQVVPGQNSVLTLNGLDQVTASTVSVNVQGQYGNDRHEVALAFGFRDFALDPLQTSATIQPGTDSVTLGISTAGRNGFDSPIQLSCLHAVVRCSFDPAIVTPGGHSTATISGLSALSAKSLELPIAGTSNGVTHQTQVQILVGDFAFSTPSYGGEVIAGHQAQFPLTLTSYNQFQGTVQLACANAPDNATCAVKPETVTLPSGGTVQTMLTVTTTSRTMAPAPWDGSGAKGQWLLLWLAGAGLLLCAARWRWRPALGLGLLLIAGAACGSPVKPRGTPAGGTTLTLTATSGKVHHVLPFVLIVQ